MDFMKNIKIEHVAMPWGETCVKASYDDNADFRLKGFKVIIVKDSLNSNNERLITIITRFPRCILPEVNTHRVFSRNSASSRARNVRTTIGGVMEEPYVPIFSENHKGMSGEIITDDNKIKEATRLWLEARDKAVESELKLLVGDKSVNADDYKTILDDYYEHIYNNNTDDESFNSRKLALSIHKQNANRLIEPFMWHEALITSSYWDNFYNLRISNFAQPEIHALACLMLSAATTSKPVGRMAHIPFINDECLTAENIDGKSWKDIRDILMSSASECARISYNDRSHLANKEDNTILAERLLKDGHMSPLEHQALDINTFKRLLNMMPKDVIEHCNNKNNLLKGNLSDGWVQNRHILGN